MTERKKQSWIPIAAAFLIPLLPLVALIYIQATRRGPVTVEDRTPINVMVYVVNKKGKPLEDKTVLIARDDVEGVPSSNPVTVKTDAAGIATLTIEGTHDYIIRVEHAVFRQRIAPVKPGTPVELSFTVDQ
ncbi:hypothetical protein IT570_01025 [Candidatus Sumerlaeota bacterium]|nr:hypothetical protein [Candidatus Sumerlaeota bacterium]